MASPGMPKSEGGRMNYLDSLESMEIELVPQKLARQTLPSIMKRKRAVVVTYHERPSGIIVPFTEVWPYWDTDRQREVMANAKRQFLQASVVAFKGCKI